MTGSRIYYSVRAGKHPTRGRLDLDGLRRLLLSTYSELKGAGLFQQKLGYDCVDAGCVPGAVGTDIEAFFFRSLKKANLWPVSEAVGGYSEEDVFDVIELLHDCASKGVDGRYHSWGDCGWHYETFDVGAGQNEFRSAFNEILREYSTGFGSLGAERLFR